ncbi:FMN-dependent NADH-azoreductase [Marinobacterium lacunae]|uniref:FMN dependent NADH:quinone oxidoreductase n=1 Tax=Marinobacterium lacunae TaxID=1232683 RepID=A0A081FWR9_9GAMM|nr:NAD(P)H-dependent oxidoreductase [Marinobacterium lacunae]KEA62974.1 FMN-dependent NADH-azoreductase [Marinobacterium lacunae]
MTNILRIDASMRTLDTENATHRSLSRALAERFCDAYGRYDESTFITCRDVGSAPPPFIDRNWLAAVFTQEASRTVDQHILLDTSDQLIAELERADLIVISSPMYNYGMPASLKAWFDQVVRVNKTFDFDLERGDFPLAPLLSGKTLVLLTSCGEFGFGPGEIRETMNHLGPHVRTLGKYLGVETFHEVRIEYQEFGDARHHTSIEQAQQAVDALARALAHRQASASTAPVSLEQC